MASQPARGYQRCPCGSRRTVGTLRRSFKLAELDEDRGAALDAVACSTPSPAGAVVIDITELALAAKKMVASQEFQTIKVSDYFTRSHLRVVAFIANMMDS